MKKLILAGLFIAMAFTAWAGTNITGQFSVDGSTIVQRPSGELYVSESGLTTTTASIATKLPTTTFNNYTSKDRTVFGGYSRNQIVCWKSNRTLGFCNFSTVRDNGSCNCR